MTYQAIETRYKGYRFRSRLEARWAVFFDALNIRYEYEKEGFNLEEAGYYLPDFWLPELKIWLEVKGGEPSWEEIRKAQELYYAGEKERGWGVVIGIGEPHYGDDLRVFCFEATESSAGAAWFSGCKWYCDGQVTGVMTHSLAPDRRFIPNHIYSMGAIKDHDSYLLASAADAARSARFEHEDRWIGAV
jgi:hypothetical protein